MVSTASPSAIPLLKADPPGWITAMMVLIGSPICSRTAHYVGIVRYENLRIRTV